MNEIERSKIRNICNTLHRCCEGRNTLTEEIFSRSQIDSMLYEAHRDLNDVYLNFWVDDES